MAKAKSSITVRPSDEMKELLERLIAIFQQESNEEIEKIASISFSLKKKKLQVRDSNRLALSPRKAAGPQKPPNPPKPREMECTFIRGRYVCPRP
jgi:hypothetical protein